jgi:hypothetical protein
MSILSFIPENSGSNIFLFLGIFLTIVLIVIVAKYLSPQESYEVADPEKLMDNIMEYRDACLNKIVSYILLQYGVPVDKMENMAKSYQSDLECVLIDIPVGDLDIQLHANYETKKYTLNATQVMSDGTIKVVSDVADMKDDIMCDYIWVQNFIDEFQDEIADWKNKAYDVIFNEVGSIAASFAQQMNTEKLKDEALYASILEFSHLFEKNKYKKAEVIKPYALLIAYLYASEKQKDFVEYIEQGSSEEKEEV